MVSINKGNNSDKNIVIFKSIVIYDLTHGINEKVIRVTILTHIYYFIVILILIFFLLVRI